jgi:mRNA interferase MazF
VKRSLQRGQFQRGEVRWVRFPGPDKRRPVVLLTRNSALRYLTSVTVAPLTSTVRDIPSQVLLTPEDDGVPALCAASLDNVQTVRKAELGALVTTLSSFRLREIEYALCFALGMDRFLPLDE